MPLLTSANKDTVLAPITGMKVWLSPEAGNITLNGTTVSQWSDISGQANHLTQGTASKQPIYITSTPTLGGRPSLLFNAANSTWLGKTSASGISTAPITIYLVVADDIATPGSTSFWIDENGGSQRSVLSYQSNGLDFFSGSHMTVPSVNGAAKMICYVINGSSSVAYVNSSVQAISGNPGSAGLDSITLGGSNGGGGSFQSGHCAEVIIYSGAHTASQVAQNFSYFQGKYLIADNAGIGLVPASLSGLCTWFRSDLGITQSAGKAIAWLDQSATGLLLNSKVGATSFPTYNTSGGPNNLPYLSFSGTQFIGFNSGETGPAPTATTAFCVMQFNPSSQLAYCFYNNQVAIPTILDSSGTRTFRDASGTDLTFANATNNWEMWSGTCTSGAQVFRVNGQQVSSATSTYSPPTGSTVLGFGGGTTAHPFTGGVVEYICYNRVLSASEIAVVENYLSVRYQIANASQLNYQPALIPNLAGWWRSDQQITLATGVSSWGDLSGNGGTVTQATGANQPAYSSAGINGNPKLTFSGTTQILENTAQNLVPTGSNRTIFAVCTAGSSSGGGCVVGCKISTAGSTAVQLNLYQVISSNVYVFTDGSSQNYTLNSGSTVSTSPQVLSWTWSLGAQPTFSVNGVSQAISSANIANTDSGTTGFSIGKRADAVGAVFVGDIYEIIVFSRLLTAAETAQIGQYLATRYGGI